MLQRNFLLAFCSLTFFLFSCSSPQSSNSVDKKGQSANTSMSELKLDLDIYKEVLSNGLTVMIIENHQLPIVSYYTFFNVGGRHESPGTTGATHFLEHMMFKGAKKYGPGQFDTLIEGAGGNTNAYTTFDNTVYHQNIPKDLLDTIIDLEVDRMQNLLLAPEAFEKERQVVMEERKLRYENSPQGKLYLAMMQEVFKGTPYGGSVIGELSDLISLKREQVYDFFKKYYAPNNAVLVVAGDVDKAKLIKKLRDSYGGIPRSPAVDELRKQKDNKALFRDQTDWGNEILLNGNNTSPLVMLAFPGLPMGERRAYVMDILSSVIGDGDSAHLFQSLVKNKPVFSEIHSANYNMKYHGVFFISGQLLDGVSIEKAKKALMTELNKACSEKSGIITERNLQKIKNQYIVSYFQEIQTNAGLASFLGSRETFYGDYNYYQKEMAIYDSITVSDLLTECKETLQAKSPILVAISNKFAAKK